MPRILAWLARAPALALALGLTSSVHAEPPAIDPAEYAHTNDLFGSAVAVDGEWAAVGAPGDNTTAFDAGAVYMYQRDGDEWTLHSRLVPEDSESHTGLGSALALSGDTLIAGSDPAPGQRGAARIYVHTTDGWRQQALLQRDPEAVEDSFGLAVAIDGDDAAVLNGRSIIDGSYREGALHLYRRDGDEWREAGTLPATRQSHLALAGGTLALTPEYAPGEVQLYRRQGEVWTLTGVIDAAMAGATSSYFASDIAMHGDTLAITDDLRVILFARDGETWRLQGAVEIPDTNEALQEQEKHPLAVTADHLAYALSDFSTLSESVHLFARTETGWVADGVLVAADAFHDPDRWYQVYGGSLAFAGDQLFVGAMRAGAPVGEQSGSVYLYDRRATATWDEVQRLVPGEPPAGCGCRSTPRDAAPLWLLLALLTGRRKRRTR
jgi:MYXO-CTERM domain-containing protein